MLLGLLLVLLLVHRSSFDHEPLVKAVKSGPRSL